jgi:hypothetical protein
VPPSLLPVWPEAVGEAVSQVTRLNVGNAEIVTCAIPADPLQERCSNPVAATVWLARYRNATVPSNPARTATQVRDNRRVPLTLGIAPPFAETTGDDLSWE